MKNEILPEDFDKTLQEFKGAHANLWIFSPTFSRIILKLWFHNHKLGPNRYLYIGAIGCKYFQGNISWDNVELRIEKHGTLPNDIEYLITDNNSNFKLLCTGGLAMFNDSFGSNDRSFEDFVEKE